MSQEASSNAPDTGTGSPPATAAGGTWVQGFNPLPTGTRIGELVIQSVLGAGQFGITYIAEHEKRSKRYVLKEYIPREIAYRDGPTVRAKVAHGAAYAWGLERFLSEARGLQQVKHPALVSIHGVTQHGGTAYVGMSYEQGRDFGIWLHEQKKIAPQEELDKVLAPLLEGLELAHASKVFHFDLNPDCIIIRDNGTPVMVDFGVFRVGLRRRMPPGNLKDQTYAAPELLASAGGPIGPWTDIYSLAGLLYLAVTGNPPLSAVERANGDNLVPAGKAAQGRYRSEFLAAIDSGLQLTPAKRPRTLGEWTKPLLRATGSRFGLSRLTSGTSGATAAPAASPAPVAKAAKPAEPPPVAEPEVFEDAADRARQEDAFDRGGVGPAAEAVPLMENAGFRAIFFGIAGLLGGSAVGALSSIIVASLLRPECGGDNCVSPFVLPLALIGAVVGVWEGLRYARKPIANERKKQGYEL